jgi:hypothetical protein
MTGGKWEKRMKRMRMKSRRVGYDDGKIRTLTFLKLIGSG